MEACTYNPSTQSGEQSQASKRFYLKNKVDGSWGMILKVILWSPQNTHTCRSTHIYTYAQTHTHKEKTRGRGSREGEGGDNLTMFQVSLCFVLHLIQNDTCHLWASSWTCQCDVSLEEVTREPTLRFMESCFLHVFAPWPPRGEQADSFLDHVALSPCGQHASLSMVDCTPKLRGRTNSPPLNCFLMGIWSWQRLEN